VKAHSGRRLLSALLAAWLAAMTAFALLRLATFTSPLFSWLGLLLAAAAPLSMLALQATKTSRRPSPHPLAFTTVSGLGVAICMALSFRHGPAAGSAHLYAGASLILWVAFLRFIPRQNQTPES
jgi:apolipoprotein N-acyltransferase